MIFKEVLIILKVLDIFSGCGGFSCGFEQAGTKIIGAIEFDKDAAETFKNNHKNAYMFLGDITSISMEDVKNKIGYPDIIIGGPPCQGFSIAGKRDINDSRNKLPLEFIHYVDYFQPKAFVMENVKGILSMENGKVINFILESFIRIGYNVQIKVMEAVKYGIAQLRERVIIVGIRSDIQSVFEFPKEINEIKSLYDVIGDIEITGTYEETGQYNHSIYSKVDENLFYLLGEGKFLCDVRNGINHVHSWDIALKGECTKKEKDILIAIANNRRKKIYGTKDGNPLPLEVIRNITGHQDIEIELQRLTELKYIDFIDNKYDIHDRKINVGLRRFSRHLPVNTITTQSGINSSYAHYSQPRNFTVREVARIQTFPDNFIFYGKISKQYRQVGNAVPPDLSKLIAEKIKDCLVDL